MCTVLKYPRFHNRAQIGWFSGKSDIRIKAYYRIKPDFYNSGYGFRTVEKNFSERISRNPSIFKSWISEGELRLGNKAIHIHYFWNHVRLDSLQSTSTIPGGKHIQYFQNRLGLDRFVWFGRSLRRYSWAGWGPERTNIHWFHGVGEWGAASNFPRERKGVWTVTFERLYIDSL